MLEVVSLRLVHDQNDTVIHRRKLLLLVCEARRVHLELGLADVRLVGRVVVPAPRHPRVLVTIPVLAMMLIAGPT